MVALFFALPIIVRFCLGFPLDNRQRSSDKLRALFSMFSGYEMTEPTLKKWRWRENASLTRIGGAWIAELPDNGMAQWNLCTGFSISSGGRTDVRRHQESARHAKLAKSRLKRPLHGRAYVVIELISP